MNVTRPQPATVNLHANNEPTVNKIGLGVSLLLLFATFPYFFISADSQGSLINVFMSRNGVVSASGAFWGHFIVACIGLFVFYASESPRWIGWKISTHEQVTALFYQNRDMFSKSLWGAKGLVVLIVCFSLYQTLLHLAAGEIIPRFSFRNVLISSVLLLILWNIVYIDPKPLSTLGLIIGRNRPLWIMISPSQICYIARFTETGEEEWVAQRSGIANLSYTDAYLFDTGFLTHTIKQAKTAQSLLGEFVYNLTIRPVFSQFPKVLDTDRLNEIHTRLGRDADLTSLVASAFNRDLLIKVLSDGYFDPLSNVYATTHSTILENINEEVLRNFQSLKKKLDFSPIEADCRNRILAKIWHILGAQNGFTVEEFGLVDIKLSDGEIKRIMEDIKQRTIKTGDANVALQGKIVGDAIDILKNPANSPKRAKDLIKSISDMKDMFMNSPASKMSPEVNTTLPAALLKDASVLVLDTIHDSNAQGLSIEATQLALLEATPVFVEHQIPVDSFMARFFEKMTLEKEARSEEAYRQLVEDTLLELSSKTL